MKKFIYSFLILTLTSCSFFDNRKEVIMDETDFDFSRFKTDKIKTMEENYTGVEFYKSYSVSLSESYFPEIEKYNFAQPLIFERDTLNLDTSVSYFYTEKDSLVRLIEYSWNQDIERKPFIDSMYSFNKRIINNTLRDNGEEIFQDEGHWWQKKTIWENDTIYVFSFVFGYDSGQRTRVIIRQKG